MITLTSADSTMIAEEGYDAATRILAIKFVTSPEFTYFYSGFPPERYEAFKSGSLGGYFLGEIKNKFPFKKEVSL